MKIVHINTNYVKNTLHQSMMDVMLGMGIESKVICPTCDFKTSVVKPKDYVEICECFSKMDRVWYGNKQRKILSHIISNYDLSGYDICHAYTLFTDGNVAYNLSDSNSANRHLGAMHYYVRSSSESETTVNYIKVYDGAPNITKDAVHHF